MGKIWKLCCISWRTQYKTNTCVGFPVRYGICDSLLIGHGRIDVVRDHCVGPTELLPGNPNPKLRKIPGSLVRHCAYILRTPQHNIALENGETVDIGVE